MEELRWIRQCSQFEVMMELLHQKSLMLTCYCLTLNSAKPLQEYHIRRTLLHLLRKVPNLRVCMRPRGKDLWFCEMEHENIDFETVKNANVEEEFDAITEHFYNVSDGPLWCARLLPCPPDESSLYPEVQGKYPHHYKLLLGFHHAITDGSSTMKTCGFLITILNDIIAGKPVNDNEQLAYFASDDQSQKLAEKEMTNFKENPKELEECIKLMHQNYDVLFLKAYPPPDNIKPKTKGMVRELNAKDTAAFLARCKTEGVSVHSGLCTVFNAALVQMLSEAGEDRQMYDIPTGHTINLRRYWEGDTSLAFGNHLGFMGMMSKCSRNIDNDFWNHARKFHEELQFSLNKKAALKLAATMLLSASDAAEFEKTMAEGVLRTYYVTTNMGNISKCIPENCEHVQVTTLRRTTSTGTNICSHVIQSFRGRILYGLDYEASLVSRDTAQLVVNTIFKILKSVS